MEKDYLPSKRYTPDQLDSLDVPYKYRDFCQDDLAEYTQCTRSHPRVFENAMIYGLPFSEYYTRCKPLKQKWDQCEDYREKEVFEEMRKLFIEQTRKVIEK